MFLLAIIFIFLLIILLFSSKTLSPIPYFPTNKKDLPLIIKALNLQNNQTVIDLGAGDGIVIFEAAKKAYQKSLNTEFVAVEINPILVLILHLRRLFNPNKNIEILWADMFKVNLKTSLFAKTSRDNQKSKVKTTVFVYISPWYLKKIHQKLKKELKKFELISYFYSFPTNKNSEVKVIKGRNKIFILSR